MTMNKDAGMDGRFGVELADVFAAAKRIGDIAVYTRMRRAYDLSARFKKSVWLKMETMQDTGAFKIRGAANRMLALTDEEKKRGVITVSSGNHGRAVAYVARRLGIRAVICMAEIAPQHKIDGIRVLGGEVIIHGRNQDDADEKARELAEADGLTFISPFDDPLVIAGQGTIALEMLQSHPELDTLIVPLSGGGLMSGIALAAKAIKPGIHIVGVSTKDGAAMFESIKAGRIVSVEETPSLADALPGPIPPDNKYTFDICRNLVDEIVQVSEDEIGAGMAYAHFHERIVLEGAGAVGLSALISDHRIARGENVGVVCSGANIDPKKYADIVSRYGDAVQK